MKNLAPLMEAALRWLADATPGSAELLRLMDATPIPCGHPVITARRSGLHGWAGYGYCPSHSRWCWGSKLLIICTCDETVTGFGLANPRLYGEREQAKQMLQDQPANRPLAAETVTQIAAADHGQIGAAPQAGRLLIPTRSLPDRFDIPHPLAPAPRDRVAPLLGACYHARTASAQATAAVATIAAEIRAPSHILTLARAANRRENDFTASSRPEQAEPELHDAQVRPGPVERILHDLGVTNPATLVRASAIDQLSEQLILSAGQASEPGQEGLDAFGLSRSTSSAELINHILASGSPHIPGLRSLSPSALRSNAENADRAAAGFRCIGHQTAGQEPQAEAEP